MGGNSSSIESLSNTPLQKLLLWYTLIDEIQDNNLGHLKLYKKKQFNYSYMSLAHKLIRRYQIEDCRNMIVLGQRSGQGYKKYKNMGGRLGLGKIRENSVLWLKVLSCELGESYGGSQQAIPIKICIQFLNFTLKEYITNSTQILLSPDDKIKSHQYNIPPNLAYILSCIIDGYIELRTLHEFSPCINILPMITSLTSPALIYITIHGYIKFLPLPLFLFPDNLTKIDRYFMQCCQSGFENQKNWNAKSYKYSLKTISSNITNKLQKLDSYFLQNCKNLIKYIQNQTTMLLQNRGSQETSQAVITNYKNNRHNHSTTSILTFQRNSQKDIKYPKPKYPLFWDLLQTAASITDITELVKNTPHLPQNLEFSTSNNSNSTNTLRNLSPPNQISNFTDSNLYNQSNFNSQRYINQQITSPTSFLKIKKQHTPKTKTHHNQSQYLISNTSFKSISPQTTTNFKYNTSHNYLPQGQQPKTLTLTPPLKEKNSLKTLFQTSRKMERYQPSKTTRSQRQDSKNKYFMKSALI